VSSAERRAIIHGESHTQVWVSDLVGIIPAITGKIELVYEGEQEGPYQVAVNLVDKSIRSQFVTYFPNPEQAKKKRSTGKRSQEEKAEESPYKSITRWFDSGNHVDILVDIKDEDKIAALYKVDGLYAFVKKFFPQANEKENALMMEFVLHGLASYSLISKKVIEGRIEFKDLMGSMMNLKEMNFGDDDDDLTEDDMN
jgi:magnesium chelatase subunit I